MKIYIMKLITPLLKKITSFLCKHLTPNIFLYFRDPEVLDIGAHEVLPRLFKEKLSNSS